jgi:hypothetical protein
MLRIRSALHFPCFLLCGLLGVAIGWQAAVGAEKKGVSMSYREAQAFLAKHTKIVELKDDAGARVIVAPQWQGRVMTSTFDRENGPSFGFINRDYIAAGTFDKQFNNYGAEERMWLSPEGGQFSLWFKPGVTQELKNWFTAPGLNEGEWKVVDESEHFVRMHTQMEVENASATKFSLDVTRDVRLLGIEDFRKLFGDWPAGVLGRSDVKMVAYETVNRVANRGPEFKKEGGLISIWILGMMNAGPKNVILVPYKPGPMSELGPVVKSDYFGPILPERLQITPHGVLFMADSHFRSKIGISQRRARNVLGSIDFEAGVLTLVNFNMPEDPTKCDYLDNSWKVPQKEPFVGDVANAYNDGPNDLGKQMGAFYEIESLSPAKALRTNEAIEHCHRTVHIQANMEVLTKLADEILGIDLAAVRRIMLKGQP